MCDKSDKIFLEVLKKHAPRKKKILRANHSSYVSKAVRKTIMKRSYLEKLYFKSWTENSVKTYKRQKSYCSRLYKKERKEFFNNLNPSFVKDNNIFWKTIKPFFSDKTNLRSQIKLTENDELIQNDDKVAETLNTFFKNAVSTLDINENSYIVNNESSTILDPVERAIKKYEIHASILLIKNKIGNQKSFKLEGINVSNIVKEIKTINPNKATPSGNILPKILKLSSDTTATTLQELFNELLSNCKLLDKLKSADITPVLKKKTLWIKQIIDLQVFCHLFLKYMRNYFKSK